MNIEVNNFSYQLPPERIAKYPLSERDQSKLLFYRNGKIKHQKFVELPELLPPRTTLFFNDTKVIPARMIFQKSSGAHIEIFLLNPIFPTTLLDETLRSTSSCTWWHCTGN